MFPIKALRGALVSEAEMRPWGLAGDRRWLVTDPEGRFLTQRDHPGMTLIEASNTQDGIALRAPDGGGLEVGFPDPATTDIVQIRIWKDVVPALPAGHAADQVLSGALGTPCRLVYLADPTARRIDPAYAAADASVNFADGFPVLIATAASLAALNAKLPLPVPMLRFRPTLVIEGTEAWAEDHWRVIRVGPATLRLVKPCERCIVTTIDPETATRPDTEEPLRTLRAMHRDRRGRVIFGQNAIPLSGGVIRIGDHVEVIEQGASNLA